MSQQPKVALVHDDFTQSGGAESLFATIAALYPNAPIYTSLVDWDKLPKSIEKSRISTSFMQKIPFAAKIYKLLLPLYPLAFESFNFDEFDLVVSSTTRFAKSIITKPGTVHVCYINSVPRFLYSPRQANQYMPHLLWFMARPFTGWLKRWDKVSAIRPDYFIANSQNIERKIKKIYNLDSEVIYPFADTEFFKPTGQVAEQKGSKYYLVVSRLVKWKRIDIAIKACQDLDLKLKIIGSGPDGSRLRNLVNINSQQIRKVNGGVEFVGQVSKEELRTLYQGAKALLVTQEEDFGITSTEAQACGIPVIAFGRGGSKETVINKKTGVFFALQDPSSLKDAILLSSGLKYNKLAIRNNALRFTKSIFEEKFKETINKYAKSA